MNRALAKSKGRDLRRILAMSDADFTVVMSRPLSSSLSFAVASVEPHVGSTSGGGGKNAKLDPGPLGGAERGVGGKDSKENELAIEGLVSGYVTNTGTISLRSMRPSRRGAHLLSERLDNIAG